MFDILKHALLPGSTWCLVICATPLVILLWGGHRSRAWGRALLAILVGSYWISSLPFVAEALTALVSTRAGAEREQPPQAAGVPIVILGNGTESIRQNGFEVNWPYPQTALNIVAGLERHRADPTAAIIASGGVGVGHRMTPEAVSIRDQLLRGGVPPEAVLLEASSTTTREQANGVAAILRNLRSDRCVLVTSPTQMRRAVGAFRRDGVVAYPATALTESENAVRNGSSRWLPHSAARATSGDAVYELIAIVYYRLRGWI
jgi:uncharacterized SAM-binding protein YcdF (DUF218 family)